MPFASPCRSGAVRRSSTINAELTRADAVESFAAADLDLADAQLDRVKIGANGRAVVERALGGAELDDDAFADATYCSRDNMNQQEGSSKVTLKHSKCALTSSLAARDVLLRLAPVDGFFAAAVGFLAPSVSGASSSSKKEDTESKGLLGTNSSSESLCLAWDGRLAFG